MSGYIAKPDSTNVFKNSYKTEDKHPDYKGRMALSVELLRSLVEEAKAGNDVEIDIAMWVKKQGDGTPFFGTRVSKSMPREKSDADTAVEDPWGVTSSAPSAPPPVADDEVPF